MALFVYSKKATWYSKGFQSVFSVGNLLILDLPHGKLHGVVALQGQNLSSKGEAADEKA